MRTYFLLALLILAAVIALWFQEDIKQKLPQISQTDEHFPDYFMENFSITSIDENGAINYTLQASKMLHYADDDSAELENPVLVFDDTGRKFTLRAERATFLQQENLLHLHDNVSIARGSTQQQNELSIETDYLKINTQSRIAETEQTARVKTRELNLTTEGLVYDNKQGILTLTSQVKGIYEAIP